jgi:hypothetical protein
MIGGFLYDAITASTDMQNSIQNSYISDANIASNIQQESTNSASSYKAILDQDITNENGKTGNALSEAQQQFTLDNTKFQEMQSEMQGLTQTSQQTASQESQNYQQSSQIVSNLTSILSNFSQALAGLN